MHVAWRQLLCKKSFITLVPDQSDGVTVDAVKIVDPGVEIIKLFYS
jgi:hypothetical protein